MSDYYLDFSVLFHKNERSKRFLFDFYFDWKTDLSISFLLWNFASNMKNESITKPIKVIFNVKESVKKEKIKETMTVIYLWGNFSLIDYNFNLRFAFRKILLQWNLYDESIQPMLIWSFWINAWFWKFFVCTFLCWPHISLNVFSTCRKQNAMEQLAIFFICHVWSLYKNLKYGKWSKGWTWQTFII